MSDSVRAIYVSRNPGGAPCPHCAWSGKGAGSKDSAGRPPEKSSVSLTLKLHRTESPSSSLCPRELGRGASRQPTRARGYRHCRAHFAPRTLLLPRAWRSISRGREGALRREVLRAKPMDARTVGGSSRDSPKHDSTACDRNRWCARPTENTDAPIQTGKIPR